MPGAHLVHKCAHEIDEADLQLGELSRLVPVHHGLMGKWREVSKGLGPHPFHIILLPPGALPRALGLAETWLLQLPQLEPLCRCHLHPLSTELPRSPATMSPGS